MLFHKRRAETTKKLCDSGMAAFALFIFDFGRWKFGDKNPSVPFFPHIDVWGFCF